MVKFSVPISSIMGLSYYRYELTSSDYNPLIDTSITITCTCKNVFGNPVASKELTLYLDGTSKGTATTNSSGVATWTVTMSNWGLQTFSIGNSNVQVNVKGFKQVKSYADGFYTLAIDGSTRTARLKATLSSTSLGSGENYAQTGWIPSDYRPVSTIYTIIGRSNIVTFYANNSGDVRLYNTTSSTTTLTATSVLYWNY